MVNVSLFLFAFHLMNSVSQCEDQAGLREQVAAFNNVGMYHAGQEVGKHLNNGDNLDKEASGLRQQAAKETLKIGQLDSKDPNYNSDVKKLQDSANEKIDQALQKEKDAEEERKKALDQFNTYKEQLKSLQAAKEGINKLQAGDKGTGTTAKPTNPGSGTATNPSTQTPATQPPPDRAPLFGDNGSLRLTPDGKVAGYQAKDGTTFNTTSVDPKTGNFNMIDPITGQTATVNPKADFGSSPVTLGEMPKQGTLSPANVAKSTDGIYSPTNTRGTFETAGNNQLVTYKDGANSYQYVGRDVSGNALYRASNGHTATLDLQSGQMSFGSTAVSSSLISPSAASVVGSNIWAQGSGAVTAGVSALKNTPVGAAVQILPSLFIPGWTPPRTEKR